MTIFLFANVLTSGINLTHNVDLTSRRNKFIFALSMAIGVGVSVWPWAFQDQRGSPYTAAFWTCADCSPVMQGVRNGISIFLSTGYCIGTVIAMLLNTILPADVPVAYADDEDLALEDDTEADPSKAKELQDAPEEAAADKSSEEVEEEASP